VLLAALLLLVVQMAPKVAVLRKCPATDAANKGAGAAEIVLRQMAAPGALLGKVVVLTGLPRKTALVPTVLQGLAVRVWRAVLQPSPRRLLVVGGPQCHVVLWLQACLVAMRNWKKWELQSARRNLGCVPLLFRPHWLPAMLLIVHRSMIPLPVVIWQR